MGMARVSPGRGTLQLGPADSVRFETVSEVAEYALVPGAPQQAAAILECPDDLLFQRLRHL